MNLAEFINRACSYFDKTESAIAASPEQAAKIAELEVSLASAQADALASVALRAELEAKLTAKDAEITALKASVEAEKKRTDETLAAMGVPAKDIPIQAQPAAEDVLAKFAAIADPFERAAFWNANKAAITKAYRKQ